MEFTSYLQIELQKNCNIASLIDNGWSDVEIAAYEKGWDDYQKMITDRWSEANGTTNPSALPISDVVQQREQLFCGYCGNKRELSVLTDANSGRACKNELCPAK